MAEPPAARCEASIALRRRADALTACQEGSGEETELKSIVDLLESYEAKRWPLGKDPAVARGKG